MSKTGIIGAAVLVLFFAVCVYLNHYGIWQTVDYKLIKTIDYSDESAQKAPWRVTKDDTLFIGASIAFNKTDLERIEAWREFTYPDKFDFSNHNMLISYGREVIGLEFRKHQSDVGFDSTLRLTYGEFVGFKIFFYQIGFSQNKFGKEEYFMYGKKRVQVKYFLE